MCTSVRPHWREISHQCWPHGDDWHSKWIFSELYGNMMRYAIHGPRQTSSERHRCPTGPGHTYGQSATSASHGGTTGTARGLAVLCRLGWCGEVVAGYGGRPPTGTGVSCALGNTGGQLATSAARRRTTGSARGLSVNCMGG